MGSIAHIRLCKYGPMWYWQAERSKDKLGLVNTDTWMGDHMLKLGLETI